MESIIRKIVLTSTIMLILSCSTRSGEVTALSSLEFYEQHFEAVQNGRLLLIDGRTDKMFSEGHIENAINIDADDENLQQLLEEHAGEPVIAVYCTTIRRTTKIVNTLLEFYTGEIIYIKDGITGWKANNLPVRQ